MLNSEINAFSNCIFQNSAFRIRPKDAVMYSVPDDDLELLESYLDDALSDEEVDGLRLRLAREPDLATALRQLHEERSQRQVYFESIDPTPAEVEQFVGSAHAAARRRKWWQDSRRLTRWGSAVAACLAIALIGAFFYNASGKAPLGSPLLNDGTALTAPGGQLPVTQAKYAVEVTDVGGHVVAVQHFDNPDDAAAFRRDLRQMQIRRQQDGTGMTVMDHDF
jgi:hypothetical protein